MLDFLTKLHLYVIELGLVVISVLGIVKIVRKEWPW